MEAEIKGAQGLIITMTVLVVAVAVVVVAVSYTHLDVYKRQYPHKVNGLFQILSAVECRISIISLSHPI